MPDAMTLPQVKLLASPGMRMQPITPPAPAGPAAPGDGPRSGSAGDAAAAQPGKLAGAGDDASTSSSDTSPQQDVGARGAAAAASAAPTGQLQGASPLAAYRAGLVLLSPLGGARHFLWQLTREPPAPASASASSNASTSSTGSTGSSTASAGASSQPAVLGRLEIHWRGLNGASGRLQTQPILALPLAAAGQEVQLCLGSLPPQVRPPQNPGPGVGRGTPYSAGRRSHQAAASGLLGRCITIPSSSTPLVWCPCLLPEPPSRVTITCSPHDPSLRILQVQVEVPFTLQLHIQEQAGHAPGRLRVVHSEVVPELSGRQPQAQALA
jgi:hypothetical protein